MTDDPTGGRIDPFLTFEPLLKLRFKPSLPNATRSPWPSYATRTANTVRTRSPKRCKAPGVPNTSSPYSKPSHCLNFLISN